MDGSEGGLGEDHYPWSAPETSRGVSSTSPKPSHGPSTTGPSSVTVTAWTRRSCSPRTSSRGSSTKRHSGSSNGIGGQTSKGKATAPMAGCSGHISDGLEGAELAGGDGMPGLQFGDEQFRPLPGTDSAVPRHFSRPPMPPPLTPPTLQGAFFPFEDRRPSYAASVPPALDAGFIHQPNPEYGASSSSADVVSSSPESASAFPRRRSYTKTVPIGVNTSCRRQHRQRTSSSADQAGRAFSYPSKRLICKARSSR
ncbi:hypothetical protein B0I37DRAFT_394260 [Chaetomium sp. MPI-CAGE-AT-0009]|nr:hypothetical protein B0I37DRAFT_394260 [Chaetomium sp. MPI-CAGE-AT-0009]